MQSTTDIETSLLAALKKHCPTKVRAYSTDDEYRDIAVPGGRKRWSPVVEAVLRRAWVRCELLNKSNEVLGYVDNTEPARGLEDLAETKATGEHALAIRIVELVIKAQRDAMTFRDAELQALLKAQGDVVREMTSGMKALTDMYREQVEAASEVAALQERAAASPDGFDIKGLMEAAPTIMQALPMLRAMLTGESPAPNGRKT